MEDASAPPPAATRIIDRVQGAVRVAAALVYAIATLLVIAPPTAVQYADTFMAALAAGAGGYILCFVLARPFRALGACPPAALSAGVAIGVATVEGEWSGWEFVLVAFAAGLIAGAMKGYELHFNSRDLASRAASPAKDQVCLWALFFGIVMAGFNAYFAPDTYSAARQYLLGVLAALLLAHTWTRLFRPLFELCVELVVWKGYRVTAAGEGRAHVPARGPLLVIANHACWWDPLFLAKVLPRPVTPMMTSAFYDRWFLRPLMVHVFQTIRVADVHIRRETPEIQQAIQALDEGKCVVIFPEGYLRRKEEVPLRRFGRGVWEILKARPQTPVLACWIDGNWGSYASYWNGPPTKNKRTEYRRPIRVGMLPPTVVSADVLDHHLRTRLALMNLVSAAREPLGLPALPSFELTGAEERENPT